MHLGENLHEDWSTDARSKCILWDSKQTERIRGRNMFKIEQSFLTVPTWNKKRSK